MITRRICNALGDSVKLAAPLARDRTVAGNRGARKAADDDDKLSAFRRSNDELTFRDFLIGKAGESSQQFFLELMPRL